MSTPASPANEPVDYNRSSYEFAGYVFREDAFGILKRLNFFTRKIEEWRVHAGLDICDLRILDIGCGTGIAVTIPIARIGYQVTGIDINTPSITKATALTGEMDNISFTSQDITTLESEKPFHVVICSEVLEHVNQPDKFLEHINKVMADDGLLLVTVPNGYGYFEIESIIYERYPGFVSYLDLCQQAFVERYCSVSLQERHERERSPQYCEMACSSLDDETIHCNRFTKGRIKKIFEANNFYIKEFKNRTFLAGNIINIFLRESDRLLRWNGKIANYLPKWLCSDWMIVASKNDDSSSVI